MSNDENNNKWKGYVFMAFLSIQYGMQAILSKEFTSTVKDKMTLVLMIELLKFCLSVCVLMTLNKEKFQQIFSQWTLWDSIQASGIPACTYAIQNVLLQLSYPKLDPLIFNLINQTKLLWAAVFVYFFLDKHFSNMQIVSMIMLLIAAIILSLREQQIDFDSLSLDGSSWDGTVTLILASMLSGIGAALTQKSLQTKKRDSSLLTMELAVYGSFFLLIVNPPTFNFSIAFEGWSYSTFFPIFGSAIGGLLVGQVTKYAGSVRKAFSLIGGIILTAFIDFLLYSKPLTIDLLMALFLTTFSLYLYSYYPYHQKYKI